MKLVITRTSAVAFVLTAVLAGNAFAQRGPGGGELEYEDFTRFEAMMTDSDDYWRDHWKWHEDTERFHDARTFGDTPGGGEIPPTYRRMPRASFRIQRYPTYFRDFYDAEIDAPPPGGNRYTYPSTGFGPPPVLRDRWR